MILALANILDEQQLKTIQHLSKDADYEDGSKTAGWHASEVKKNEQMINGAHLAKINKTLEESLRKHELFALATMAQVVRPFIVSRTRDGGYYGPHVDNAIMFGQQNSRTDISMTVFLSDPDTYEGGNLVIEETAGERHFRLPAGSAVIYPSTTLHRVEPVTKGERIVACTWIQSRIRHAEQRELLLDIDSARRSIFKKEGKSREFDLLTKSHANLIRMWSEL